MTEHFNEIPSNLVFGIFETVLCYALGSYLNSKTLIREIWANHQAKESSKEFKGFLESLPEGVSIIDDDNSDFKFINLKFKEAFNIELFCEAQSNLRNLDRLKAKIDEEFNQIMSSSPESNHKDSSSKKLLKQFLNKFDVVKQTNSNGRSYNLLGK